MTAAPRPDLSRKRIKQFAEAFLLPPGTRVKLPDDFDPGSTAGYRKERAAAAQEILEAGIAILADYQSRLAAQATHAVLVIVQGMDAAGKDGTIRHVLSGINPQGVEVHSFKVPSAEELAHDYLWRYQARVPERGRIGIFNRSYYEEVLVVRVHPRLVLGGHVAVQPLAHGQEKDGLWRRRFSEINDYERYLHDNGIRIVKLFLNLSWEAQRERFLARIDEPTKNWKFTASDVRERAYWNDYQAAYADMLSHTSSKWAPWYVIPADNKWFSRMVAAAAIGKALMDIDPQYPTTSPQAKAELQAARRQLQAERRAKRLK